jgi:glycosyltransferase involved in cell wall biosynthesis
MRLAETQERVIINASASAYTRGGLERVVANLDRGLREQRFRPITLIPESEDSPELIHWYEQLGTRVDAVGELRLSLGSITAALKLRGLFRRYGASGIILHSPGVRGPLSQVVAAYAAGIPIRVVVYHLDVEVNDLKTRITNRLSSAFATDVVAISRHMAGTLRRGGVPAEKLSVIHNGVEQPGTEISKQEARERLGIPQDVIVVGMVSRIEREKRPDNLIRAVSLLPDDVRANVHVLIAGDGWFLGALRDQAARAVGTSVHLPGFVLNPGVIYAASDVIAITSDFEGLPLTAIEAQIRGKPVIATAVGGTPEVVEDGETGYLIPPQDPYSLKIAIEKCVRCPDETLRMGRNARLHAARFTTSRMASGYADLICQRLAQGRLA